MTWKDWAGLVVMLFGLWGRMEHRFTRLEVKNEEHQKSDDAIHTRLDSITAKHDDQIRELQIAGGQKR
jgi:hypothetical protein